MTVIRLADGSLLLHSPIQLDPRSFGASSMRSDACGTPSRRTASIISMPAEWRSRIRTRASGSGPASSGSDPTSSTSPSSETRPPVGWRGQVDQVFFAGRPYENEVTFFHRASRTLILCDLAFNLRQGTAFVTRWLMRSSAATATSVRRSSIRGSSRIAPRRVRASNASSRGTSIASSSRTATCSRPAATSSWRDGYRWLLRDG